MDADYIENESHYSRVIEDGILRAERSLWVATANVKDLRIQMAARRTESVVDVLAGLAARKLDVRLLHAGKASSVFVEDVLRQRMPFPMKACPRVHFKAIIGDGRWAYSGSANLTGAAIGLRSASKRNFENGFIVREPQIVDRIQSLFNLVWEGAMCEECAFFRKRCPGLLG